jgi:hypothetical protein
MPLKCHMNGSVKPFYIYVPVLYTTALWSTIRLKVEVETGKHSVHALRLKCFLLKHPQLLP